MNARHSFDCTPSLTHGNIIERVILCKRGAKDPGTALAVLMHVDRFARAYLVPGVASLAQTHDRTQEVFFVVAGSALLVTDREERRVGEGDGILMPPGVSHVFRNEGDAPLELLVIEETVPDGVTGGRSTPVVRNYRDCDVGVAHWHHFVHHVFGPEGSWS